MNINWENVLTPSRTDLEVVALKEAPLNENFAVKFNRVFQTASGNIGAEVTTDLTGDLIWLSSEAYGPQNGLLSLVKAATSAENIEGNTFNFSRIESDKSPTGYAYLWTE